MNHPPRSRLRLFVRSLHGVVMHIVITMLAIGVALSIPDAARYVLFEWWPRIESNPQLLLATEMGFAALLVLLGNGLAFAWEQRRMAAAAQIASLVHADNNRASGTRRPASWPAATPAPRDVCILTVTGRHTFGPENAWLRRTLDEAYEIRLLLLNPFSAGAVQRVKSFHDAHDAHTRYLAETTESLAYLRELHARGKVVQLKFYETAPFWKLVIVGDHAWVQYCHDGCEVKEQPEFTFALLKERPTWGLFAPFCMTFLRQWNDPLVPEYAFETAELVYRDAGGNETKRVPFDLGGSADKRALYKVVENYLTGRDSRGNNGFLRRQGLAVTGS